MNYSAELRFVQKILQCYHLPMNIYESFDGIAQLPDIGLRQMLNPNYDYNILFDSICDKLHPKKIYRVEDAFDCRYFVFILPDREPKTYAFVGPYHTKEIEMPRIHEIIKDMSLAPSKSSELERFYNNLPFMENDTLVLNLLVTLGESMWGSIDSFELENIYGLSEDKNSIINRNNIMEPEDALMSMRLLEERYAAEAMIMDAISHGQAHKAEMLLSNISSAQMEKRSTDPLRNMKNYSVIMNTLFRKAVEQGRVHPLHIDNLSSKFAKKIEAANSMSAIAKLQNEMIHKYCNLVKNHSLKGYSRVIRKVLTRIDSDLSADLSLHKQAELLNVNSSYLSTLFKKETGITLTEHVNRKRVEHAMYLLTSTSLQVQVIAQQCGIPDVNYFTKTFKKFTGKTPKEVRENSLR